MDTPGLRAAGLRSAMPESLFHMATAVPRTHTIEKSLGYADNTPSTSVVKPATCPTQ